MKRILSLALLVAIVGTAFVAGTWVSWHASRPSSPSGARKILYWVDPMHPSYKSDKPGIAPDCGMKLEPVYEGDEPPKGGSVPANAVRIALDKQQLIGVRVGHAQRAALSRQINTIGRVAVDETRVYRLTTNVDGRIHDLSALSSGSLVRKDDLLLTLTARDVLTAEQSFLYGLWAVDRYKKEGAEGPDQMKIAEGQVKSGQDALVNMGMSQRQIEEIRRARTPTSEIEIRSPVTGFITSRTVFPNQRCENGAELFRVADLSHVWVLADVFAEDARLVTPGMPVRVVLSDPAATTFSGRVSSALPAFDVTARAFKVRIEVDNGGYLLRPDMFVDVHFAIPLPPALSVPADAVVDSGNRKVVFVDRGSGFYEPRTVETGWRVGDRVQIVRGLMEAETIVVSGNFLLDSESRMRAAAMGVNADTSKRDPVCGMEVDPAKARAAGHTAVHGGTTYYFCSEDCKHKFEREPARYTPGADEAAPAPTRPVTVPHRATSVAKTSLPPSASLQARDPDEPLRVSAPDGASPWPGARVDDEQYVPKNRRLRRPGTGGPAMQVATPDKTEPPPAGAVQDVACGVLVQQADAKAAGLFSEYRGETYYFSSADCKKAFDANPAKYAIVK